MVVIRGYDNGHFSINRRSPHLQDAARLRGSTDADRNNVYLVTVGASDGPNTGTLEVTITVTGVNDQPRLFRSSRLLTRDRGRKHRARQIPTSAHPFAATDDGQQATR